MRDSIRNLPQNLISIRSEALPDVGQLLLDDFDQQGRNILQEVVAHVVVPRRTENAVVRLNYEVVRDVVDDYDSGQVPAQQAQVLHQEGPVERGVLSVEPVLDVPVHVDLVDDLVRVVLQRRSEDHDLVELGHQLYKVDAARPHQEVAVGAVLKV